MKTLHIAVMILIVALSAFGIFLFAQLQFAHGPELTYIVRQILPDDEIENAPGLVTIQNKTFHILNINKIAFNSNNSTEIDWYEIKFSFPHGLTLTNSTDGKFLESDVTFPYESVSNKMAVSQGFVAFSTHHNPQVGILLSNETVKLLVNWPKIHSDLAIIGLNDTYKTGQPIDFQVKAEGFDYFDGGAIPKIWVERQGGSIAWSQPHKDSIVLCCAPEFTDYDRKFNFTDLGVPVTIDTPGSYHLIVQYGDQKIQKQLSVIGSKVTTIFDTGTMPTNVTNPNITVNPNIAENNKTLQAGLKPTNPFATDKYGKVDLSKIHLSRNQYGQIDYDKIGYLVSENQFKKILDALNIPYAQDNLLLQEGMSNLTLPPTVDYCGYVKDNNTQEHWFSSSYYNDTLQNYQVYNTNPEPCKPGPPFACFCSLQTQIAENNLKELSYFTSSEENTVGDTISKYLDGGKVVNVSNEFVVGKYNLNIDTPTIHYCGKFTWGANLEYFEGYIKNSTVVDFTLAPEKQKLCAIKADPKLFSFDESTNGNGK